MTNKRYVLITPARNEEAYIEKTIQSVINQVVLPVKWIIVSDGSTDRTDEIVNKYVEQHNFIQLLSIKGDNNRNFGSQVRAINAGYEQLNSIDYEFVGNLDADVSFEPTYYGSVLEKFQQNTRLGIAGGFIYEQYNGKFISRLFNRIWSVPHAIQLFRRECYETIGGYIQLKYGGPDWHAEVMARKNSWHVESFPELRVFHHRPTSTADGVLKGRFSEGLRAFSIGSHPLFEILKCLDRVRGKPYFVGAVARMAGYIWASFSKEKRIVSKEFVQYLRKEQMHRIKSVFFKISKNIGVF